MEFIKAYVQDYLYTDLTTVEIGALIKIQALAAYFEREPSEKEILKHVTRPTYTRVVSKLQGSRNTLADMVQRVCDDAAEVVRIRCAGAARRKKSREYSKKGPMPREREEEIREEESRVDKKSASRADTTTTTLSIPSVSEVELYIKDNNKNVNAEKFVAYYASTNWKGVSNWQAKIDYWDSTERNPKKNKSRLL